MSGSAGEDLTNLNTIRLLLQRHNLRLTKRFGQNLLVDRAVLDVIVEAAEITPTDNVLEVGAGLGVLTTALAEHAGQVVAVELDRTLIPVLSDVLRGYSNTTLLNQNLLQVQPETLFAGQPYKLVANLPYYITSPTLRHFLEAPSQPRLLVIMVQREVALRLVAKPGDLSMLGVSVQFYGKPTLVATVPPLAFFPSPKVDSAIVRVDVYPEPLFAVADRDLFFRLVHAGFSQKRKQIHNTLAAGLALSPAQVHRALEAAGISPQLRAEALSLEQWYQLYRQFSS